LGKGRTQKTAAPGCAGQGVKGGNTRRILFKKKKDTSVGKMIDPPQSITPAKKGGKKRNIRGRGREVE